MGTPLLKIIDRLDKAGVWDAKSFLLRNPEKVIARGDCGEAFRSAQGTLNDSRYLAARITSSARSPMQFMQMLDAAVTTRNNEVRRRGVNRCPERVQGSKSTVRKSPANRADFRDWMTLGDDGRNIEARV